MESGRGWKDKHCKVCISVGKNRAREECSRRSETDISGIFKIYVSVDKNKEEAKQLEMAIYLYAYLTRDRKDD